MVKKLAVAWRGPNGHQAVVTKNIIQEENDGKVDNETPKNVVNKEKDQRQSIAETTDADQQLYEQKEGERQNGSENRVERRPKN